MQPVRREVEETKDEVGATSEDPIELEEFYHDADGMCAISVIEHEIAFVTNLAAKSKGDEKDYYLSKVDSLEFSKTNIEDSVGSGIITPEKYVENIKKFRHKTM